MMLKSHRFASVFGPLAVKTLVMSLAYDPGEDEDNEPAEPICK